MTNSKLTLETDYFSVHALCDGVYAVTAKPGQGTWSNAGFVDLGEELLVFDSHGTPTAGAELRKIAESMTGKKVKYLVNSHYHGDHVFGNQAFNDTVIISTAETQKLCTEKHRLGNLKTEEKVMQQYLLKLKNQIRETEETIKKKSLYKQFDETTRLLADLPRLKLVLPTLLFEQKLTIIGSKRTVELSCLGGGHTPSDTFMYLPADKIVFTGDLVTENLHLPIYDPREFVSILETIKHMDIDTVVPGHGNVGNKDLCNTLADYIKFLIRKAKEAHYRELSLPEFITGYELYEEYKDWGGINGIQTNLSSIFNYYSNDVSRKKQR
ncbi:MBL fold metallo-hydrolase [Terribacillus sp. DMT04]|uniref:MBL fold metallo-hydrolase n=1 Tax=Terribacillus sp. DMT04 TaxID=2850441 RepID=UPI001C2C62F4|nr:MBL fold metallo-hydrolase [Terribacillus sp. DMT04]QXE02827.1 MBL fold metallo-hydrolase [Terribacillus sp. DMT04]